MDGCAAAQGVTYRMVRAEKSAPPWSGRMLELSQETQGGNGRLQGATPTFAASLGMR